MKILKKDLKLGLIKILCEQVEDLWYLSHLIDIDDTVKANTERKIKIGGEDARNQKVIRKKMTLTLRVEKVTFADNNLRILGVIIDGPQDMSRGEHHSFSITDSDQLSIKKDSWASWQLEKLKDAQAPKEKILVVLFDRESALFALLTNTGHQVLSSLKGNVQKKDQDGQAKGNFWKNINKQLEEYAQRYDSKSIIAASPAFWKEYLKKNLTDELSKKLVYATVSGVDENALNEVVKRPELKSALQKDRSAKELQIIEELLKALAKDQVSYGIDEVEEKVNQAAIKSIIVSDNFLQKCREDNSYKRVDILLKSAQNITAKIVMITTQDAAKQLDGLGGIAALNRW